MRFFREASSSLRLLTGLFLAMAAVLGCAANPSKSSTVPDRAALAAAKSDMARVVFIWPRRASQEGSGTGEVGLFDGERPLGMVAANQRLQVDLKAGSHYFVATAASPDVIEATLVPGRTYYVYLWVTKLSGYMSAFLTPIAPGGSHWKEKDAWIERSRLVAIDPAAVQDVWSRYVETVRKGIAEHQGGIEAASASRAVLAEYGVPSVNRQ